MRALLEKVVRKGISEDVTFKRMIRIISQVMILEKNLKAERRESPKAV